MAAVKLSARALAHLERIFEFAYTTREGGHGLGLAMVHECVVEDHGGQVLLDSREGQGTRVTLAFPRRSAAGNEQPASESTPE